MAVYQGPCQGDSGGPLYINTKVQTNGDITGQTLAGIHSGAQGCGRKNYTQWWQRVSSFLPWIKCIKKYAELNKFTQDVEKICLRIVTLFDKNDDLEV